ncbi:MAG: phospholipase D-like domain-containing protein [Isosphaeraceae bacterium]
MSTSTSEDTARYAGWLESLQANDSKLYEELLARLRSRVAERTVPRGSAPSLTLESAVPEAEVQAIALETIVREGRPALLIQKGKIVYSNRDAETAARVILERLKKHGSTIEKYIPLVGRIDVGNYPSSVSYVGTGWLVAPNVVVTNRHVAQLIARSNDGKYHFRPGRFGDDMEVQVDFLHEQGSRARAVVSVRRVIWIEPDARKADIAFLEVDERTGLSGPQFIPLMPEDVRPNHAVAVVGYPARAPAHVIPDQAWMDQIYGGSYDIKRIAPGLMGTPSHNWSTHDCTTLGGNSGSVVLDMKTGRAVALHFAGQYLIENYAVPASIISEYLGRQPWRSETSRTSTRPPADLQTDGHQIDDIRTSGDRRNPQEPSLNHPQRITLNAQVMGDGQASITLPLIITVSLGQPKTSNGAAPIRGTDVLDDGDSSTLDLSEAAQRLLRAHRSEGVFSVWPGYTLIEGRISDDECLVVSAHPDRLDEVRAGMPSTFAGRPIEVVAAPVEEVTESLAWAEAPPTSILYNDDDRTGKSFSFDWIDEEMTVQLHVGPERSWSVLKSYLAQVKSELISSMYQFHAAHVADAVQEVLANQAKMKLVLAKESRDPSSGQIPKGEFRRGTRFEKWAKSFDFRRVFVPLGSTGLVANAYHIKVSVSDQSTVWLSSGNWRRSSQPVIPDRDMEDPRVTGAAGNREWHVVVKNATLAGRLRNHILADYERSLELGGTPEAPDNEILIDVPAAWLEAIDMEAPPDRVAQPETHHGKFRVKPLLTPDRSGKVYCEAVLELIRSAKKQLLFQNQYIKMRGAETGLLNDLVEALAKQARSLRDFRIILRSGNGELRHDLSQLKRRGLDVNTQVRLLANTHTKGIIVDGKTVLLGSHNWSSSGVTLNRDASLIFAAPKIAAYYQAVFETDWKRATEPRFDLEQIEHPRLATEAPPPPGCVRMRLSDYIES